AASDILSELTAQTLDRRAGNTESAAAGVRHSCHLSSEGQNHTRMPRGHVACRGCRREQVRAYGGFHEFDYVRRRHRYQRGALRAAETDQIEGNIDSLACGHHRDEMLGD